MRYSSLHTCDGMFQIGDRATSKSNVLVGVSIGGRIILGNDMIIGPNMLLRASGHVSKAKDKPFRFQGQTGGSIVV